MSCTTCRSTPSRFWTSAARCKNRGRALALASVRGVSDRARKRKQRDGTSVFGGVWKFFFFCNPESRCLRYACGILPECKGGRCQPRRGVLDSPRPEARGRWSSPRGRRPTAASCRRAGTSSTCGSKGPPAQLGAQVVRGRRAREFFSGSRCLGVCSLEGALVGSALNGKPKGQLHVFEQPILSLLPIS